MQTAQEERSRYEICCPCLPLAVYREVATHLRQVPGVETGLVAQRSQQFDYYQSQVGSLWIQYAAEADLASRQRVDQILAYYSNLHGAWEDVESQVAL